ncbi:helix-turn-helix transcriptional regulator [Ravibacter arvi]|uniref:Helix-turn-helix transcriptional regulator n=1 Tax=Ravibacter arvi TaxID=2051041 RepID=A0ABP8M031_9BACT
MKQAKRRRDIDAYITAKVKKLREEKGISQEKLAFHIGVSNSYVAQIESPKYRAKYNLYHLIDIIGLLECSPSEILPLEPH